jgi:hypothetical protein
MYPASRKMCIIYKVALYWAVHLFRLFQIPLSCLSNENNTLHKLSAGAADLGTTHGSTPSYLLFPH